MKKFIGLLFLIFLFNTNIVFGNNQVGTNKDCIYEKTYKTGFPNVVCKNLYDSSQKLISSGKKDLVKKYELYVGKLSQTKLIELHKNLGKLKQTDKNKDLLSFLSVLVYNTSEKYRKVDDKYIYNGFGDKIGYKPLENGKNPNIQPKTYEELATILNEKFVLDLTSFPAYTPRVYQSISSSADGGFSENFYTFMYTMMYQSKDIKLPIYLIPGWVGFEGYGKDEYGVGNSNTPSINLDISKLPSIDIKKYPSLKYIVENYCDNFDSKNRNLYNEEILKKKDNEVSKDFYQLLIDYGINKDDIILTGIGISFEDPLSKEIIEKKYTTNLKKEEFTSNLIRNEIQYFGKNHDEIITKDKDNNVIDFSTDFSLGYHTYTPPLFYSSKEYSTKMIFGTIISTKYFSEDLFTNYNSRKYLEKDIILENNYSYSTKGKGMRILYEIYQLKLTGYNIKNTKGEW